MNWNIYEISDNFINNGNIIMRFPAKIIFIRKPQSRSKTSINFNSFVPLKHKILDLNKEFFHI